VTRKLSVVLRAPLHPANPVASKAWHEPSIGGSNPPMAMVHKHKKKQKVLLF
jgi:hypothetical protein